MTSQVRLILSNANLRFTHHKGQQTWITTKITIPNTKVLKMYTRNTHIGVIINIHIHNLKKLFNKGSSNILFKLQMKTPRNPFTIKNTAHFRSYKCFYCIFEHSEDCQTQEIQQVKTRQSVKFEFQVKILIFSEFPM